MLLFKILAAKDRLQKIADISELQYIGQNQSGKFYVSLD